MRLGVSTTILWAFDVLRVARGSIRHEPDYAPSMGTVLLNHPDRSTYAAASLNITSLWPKHWMSPLVSASACRTPWSRHLRPLRNRNWSFALPYSSLPRSGFVFSDFTLSFILSGILIFLLNVTSISLLVSCLLHLYSACKSATHITSSLPSSYWKWPSIISMASADLPYLVDAKRTSTNTQASSFLEISYAVGWLSVEYYFHGWEPYRWIKPLFGGKTHPTIDVIRDQSGSSFVDHHSINKWNVV